MKFIYHNYIRKNQAFDYKLVFNRFFGPSFDENLKIRKCLQSVVRLLHLQEQQFEEIFNKLVRKHTQIITIARNTACIYY